MYSVRKSAQIKAKSKKQKQKASDPTTRTRHKTLPGGSGAEATRYSLKCLIAFLAKTTAPTAGDGSFLAACALSLSPLML